jgi:hypothetical protein
MSKQSFEIFNFNIKVWKWIYVVFFFMISQLIYAQDTTGITGVDDMISSGQSIIAVAAKWGGILTVVGSAIALGSGRLEGALAQTVCKILIVIGLLIAAFGFFGPKISYGFSF